MKRLGRREAGFTLLEMLVALVVFGLLMVGLSQTMRYGLRVWSSEARSGSSAADLATVDAALRRLIEQAAPTGFSGQPASLAWTSLLPEGAATNDRLADIALLVTADNRLVLRWTPHPAGVLLGPAPQPAEVPLLEGVRAIQLSYLVARPAGPPAWTDHLDGGGPPMLVRLHIQFAGARSWPDLVAAPVAGAQ